MVSSDNGEVLGEAEVERPAEETRALVSVEDGRLSSNDDVKLRRRHRQLEAVDPDEQAFFGGYCGGKAEVLIEKGVEQYRAEDFFDMPSVEFSDEQLAAVLSGCDQMVDAAAVLGRFAVAIKDLQITTARNEIDSVASFDQGRNSLGHVLTIAIDGHQILKTMFAGIFKGRDQCSTVTAILAMSDHMNVSTSSQYLTRAVGRTIIDNQNMVAVAANLVEHFIDVFYFVVNRQRCQEFCHTGLFSFRNLRGDGRLHSRFAESPKPTPF